MSSSRSKNFCRPSESADVNGEDKATSTSTAVAAKKNQTLALAKPRRQKPEGLKRLSFADDEEEDAPAALRPATRTPSSVPAPATASVHKLSTSKDRSAPSTSVPSIPSNVHPQAGEYTKERLRELQKNARPLGSMPKPQLPPSFAEANPHKLEPPAEPVIVLKSLLKPTNHPAPGREKDKAVMPPGRREEEEEEEEGLDEDEDKDGTENIRFAKMVHTGKHSKIITRQTAKLLRRSGEHVPSFVSLPYYGQPKGHKDGKKLDTNMFESYLEDLWSRISVEERNSYTCIDCLWFSLYKKGLAKMKVLQWIKSKRIFSRKYVFVPIICWRHWSLLILCHFGAPRSQSETGKPCMLLLDSLHKVDPKRLEPDIRRFVLDIYRSEGRKEDEEFISGIPLMIPKVPQQRNGEECGMFVLYFIYLFLHSAPQNFTLEDYPYFLNEDWFALKDLESFRKEIH